MNKGTLTVSLKFYRFKVVGIYKFYKLHCKSLNGFARFFVFISNEAENASLPKSVEDQLSIMKAIFLG